MPAMSVNGILAGLVAITAPCAFVDTWAAVVIGLVAGVWVCIATFLLEKLKIDDPGGRGAGSPVQRAVGRAGGGHLRQRQPRHRRLERRFHRRHRPALRRQHPDPGPVV